MPKDRHRKFLEIPQYNLKAELYTTTLRQMPPHGSLGESVAIRLLLRKRFVDGFKLWQQVFASAFSQSEAFGVVADTYGSILSGFPVVCPYKLPEEWEKYINDLFQKAMYELQKQDAEAKRKDGGIAVAAKEYLSDEELLKRAERLENV